MPCRERRVAFDSEAVVVPERRQLKIAQEETEKLRSAGDTYKRELLEQKLSDTEWILATEQERLKEAENDKEGQATTDQRFSCR